MWERMALKDGAFLEENRSFARLWPWGRACVSPWAEDKCAALLRRCSAGGWFPLRHFSRAISPSLSLQCSLFSAGIRMRLNASRHDRGECQVSRGSKLCAQALICGGGVFLMAHNLQVQKFRFTNLKLSSALWRNAGFQSTFLECVTRKLHN